MAALASSLLLGGCAGYKIGPIKPKYMQGVNSIAIPVFRNETLIPRIETLVSDTIIRQMQQDGTYRVAGSSDNADAIMEGDIKEVRRRPSRSVVGDVQTTQEFSMTLVIHYRLVRRATGEELDNRDVTGQTSFFVSGDVNQDERQAIPIAAEDAAVRLVSILSEGW